jgi:hypothetical protein
MNGCTLFILTVYLKLTNGYMPGGYDICYYWHVDAMFVAKVIFVIVIIDGMEQLKIDQWIYQEGMIYFVIAVLMLCVLQRSYWS